MTVCNLFKPVTLKKGLPYFKVKLLDKLQGHEKMASTFYDPIQKKLYTFFNQESTYWKNNYDQQKRKLYFSHRKHNKIDKSPKWEQALDRHVFLHYGNLGKGVYEYLGTAKGEKLISNGKVRVFDII